MNMQNISRAEALVLLSNKPIRHFTMTSLLAQDSEAVCHRVDDHLLIRIQEERGTFVAFAAGNSPLPVDLFQLMEGTEHLFYVQGDEMAHAVAQRRSVVRTSACVQFYLPDDVPVPEDEAGIIDLTPDHAAYIHSHYTYRDIMSVDYLKARITAAPAVGVMVDGVLAGFVMTHEEMTMGVMHVLPEFRKQGLATRLNAAMVRRMRALGYPCIVEIVQDNHASLALAKSTGFLPLQNVHWLHVTPE